MLTSDQLQNLVESLEPLAGFSAQELSERPKWGEINFQHVRREIDSAIAIAKEFLELPLAELTAHNFSRLSNVVPRFTQCLVNIDNFSLDMPNPGETRNQLCNEVLSMSDQLEDIAQQLIPYLRMKRGDFDESKRRLDKHAAEMDKFLQAAQESTQQFMEEAKQLDEEQRERTSEVLKNAEAAGAKIGVGAFTRVFAEEAKELHKKARIWLGVTGSFGLATLASALYFYFSGNPVSLENMDVWRVVANVGSKGAILAVLFTGTIWCGRVYRALLHQATTNKHRALSLQTFQSFVKATDDAEVKDAILLAATNASFGNTTTGLVDQKGSEGFATSLFEAVRNLKRDD